MRWCHFEIKPNKNTYIIDEVLQYGYSEKTFYKWSAVVERTG